MKSLNLILAELRITNFCHSYPPHDPIYDRLVREGLICYIGKSVLSDKKTYEISFNGVGWSLAAAKGFV